MISTDSSSSSSSTRSSRRGGRTRRGNSSLRVCDGLCCIYALVVQLINTLSFILHVLLALYVWHV